MSGIFLDSRIEGKSKKRSKVIGVVLLLLLAAGASYAYRGWFASFAASDAPALAETVPEKLKIEKKVFGASEKGRPIEGYEIGSGENTLLLFGAIHGNEMGTADLLTHLVLEIALHPEIVSKAKKLVIIPIANPDGYLDRKDKFNANGVNLNLNFGTTDWKTRGPEGTSGGPSPFSENESVVIKQVVEQYKPDLMLAYHSDGKLISPELGGASIAWGKWYAEKTGYKYFDEWDYPGTATKWFEQTTMKPAITIELSFDLQNDWDINKGALLSLIGSESKEPK